VVWLWYFPNIWQQYRTLRLYLFISGLVVVFPEYVAAVPDTTPLLIYLWFGCGISGICGSSTGHYATTYLSLVYLTMVSVAQAK
jgi:hypothetical protein